MALFLLKKACFWRDDLQTLEIFQALGLSSA